MLRRALTVALATTVLLIYPHANVIAEPTFVVDGAVKGSFCRFFGLVCSFKKIDAVSFGKEDKHALRPTFSQVTDYKPAKESDQSGLCWITTKSDESAGGWWAVLLDWWKGTPVFYAANSDGTYEKLGTPDFIVFECKKIEDSISESRRIFEACISRAAPHMTALDEGLRTLEGFLITATVQDVMLFCSEKIPSYDELGMTGRFIQFTLVEGMQSDACTKARHELFAPIRAQVVATYKSEGENVFCAWARKTYESKGDLWSRFWRNNRGLAHEQKGDKEHAIAAFTKTIKINPKDAAAYTNRGGAYEKKGDKEQAIADYRKALEINPSYQKAKEGLRLLGVTP